MARTFLIIAMSSVSFRIIAIGCFLGAAALVLIAVARPAPEGSIVPIYTLAADALDGLERLERLYPDAFARAYPDGVMLHSAASALRRGRDLYVAEGCWHCHSQWVRPVAGETERWGAVSRPEESHHELHRPPLFGNRRVGPDLARQGDRHSPDWHVAHFVDPRAVSPTSVMPAYPWFVADGETAKPPAPTRDGFAAITYLQWLGKWQPSGDATLETDPRLFTAPLGVYALILLGFVSLLAWSIRRGAFRELERAKNETWDESEPEST